MVPAVSRVQDATAIAVQQSQMATQTAMQASQQASQQAMDESTNQSMQASQQAVANGGMMPNATQANGYPMYGAPKFSVAAGRVAKGTLLRMSSPVAYARIYYTTDGWTPTPASRRYRGPIHIEHDMVLQAIAIVPTPYPMRTMVRQARYIVAGGAKPERPRAVATSGLLKVGTKLELETTTAVSSKTAQVGDTLPLRLEQAIKVGDRVVVPDGTTVEATLVNADPAGHVGIPGDLVFEVEKLSANGVTIPLRGGETMEGVSHQTRAMWGLMVPVVGLATLYSHGGDAVIQPGMPVRVAVAEDTPLMAGADGGR